MIFNLFKSKPSLKELIPKGFVDIHSHILPGIDDGAKTEAESLKLISEMKKLGFSKIIGTPHSYPDLYDNNPKTIKNAYEIVKNLSIKNINLDFASEYMLEKSIINKAVEKKLLCVKDNLVLVEMSYLSPPFNLYEIIFELKVNNFIPILAHPERYMFMCDNFTALYKLKKMGCLFQSNLLSATDYYGKNSRIFMDKLLERKMIDYVGSDIHSMKHILAFEKKVTTNKIELFKEAIDKNNYFK